MKFNVGRWTEKRGDGKTLSSGGILSFVKSIEGYIGKVMAVVLADGFDKGKPVQEIEMELTTKIDGKSLTEEQIEEIMANYPSEISLNYEALYDMLKGDVEDGR